MKYLLTVISFLVVYSVAISARSAVLKLSPRHHRQAKCEIKLNPDYTVNEMIKILCDCVDKFPDALAIVQSLGETYGCGAETCAIIACIAENGDEFTDDEVYQVLDALEILSECTGPYEIVLDNNGLEGLEYGKALLNCFEDLVDTIGNGNGDGVENRNRDSDDDNDEVNMNHDNDDGNINEDGIENRNNNDDDDDDDNDDGIEKKIEKNNATKAVIKIHFDR